MNSLSITDDLDWEAFYLEKIEISEQQVDHAKHQARSQPIDRWNFYLHLLAMIGIQQWFSDRAPDLSVQVINHSRLRVNGFDVQITTTGSFIDKTVRLLESGRSHFYIVVEVIEEQQQVQIVGFCNHAQIQAAEIDVPRATLDSNPNYLLLQLQCLDPLPLEPVSLPHVAINAAVWLRNQLDELSQSLNWLLLPASSTLAPALRGHEQFEQTRQAIERMGVSIPVTARGASRELRWGEGSLCLYTLIWELPRSEWSMLVVIVPEPEARFPDGVRLRVVDASQILVDEVSYESENSCLYGQVIGNWNEQFWITIAINDETMFEMPPFTFNMESAPS
jgi:hypothetical protein